MTRCFLVWFAAIFLSAQISLRANDALVKSAIFENDVAYLRVGAVTTNLAGEIQSAQNVLAATNQIAGTVLDLRFADGDDLNSEKAVENLFAPEKLPLAILVNGETLGAAAKLAADLRQSNDGLIFGSAAKELNPDILVSVKPDAEKEFLKNPFGTLAQGETNSAAAANDFLPAVDHTSEADLVREKIKDGDEAENSAPPRAAVAPPKPFIRDPVLARAVDLIKGLAIVRESHL